MAGARRRSCQNTPKHPFELKVPNAETRAAIESSRATMKARRARFTDPKELFDALNQEACQQ